MGMVFMCLTLVGGMGLLILCLKPEWRQKLRRTLASYHIRSNSGTMGKAAPRSASVSSDDRYSRKPTRSASSSSGPGKAEDHAQYHQLSRHASVEHQQSRHDKRNGRTSRTSSKTYADTPPGSVSSGGQQPSTPVHAAGKEFFPKSILRNSTRNSTLTSGYDSASPGGNNERARTSKTVHMDQHTHRVQIQIHS